MPKDQKITLTIKTSKGIQTIEARKGLGFQAICATTPTPLEFDCRHADCGICIFKVLKGMSNLSEPTIPERDFLKAMHAGPEERLGCQTRIFGDVDIEVEFI
jgi:ferredoxin